MTITYVQDSLFNAPRGTILLHACNCHGSWGAGIAAQFRKLYPKSYKVHQSFCAERSPDVLLGTTQLIDQGEGHSIGCLFTSRSHGRQTDSPEVILKSTRLALEDLKSQLAPGDQLSACKFNSGLFRTPWPSTEKIINDLGIDMTVYELK